MKRNFFYIFLFALLIGLSPLVIAFAGIGLASALDCNFSHTGPEACMVMGVDLGPTLMTMMMMHWLGIISLPIAAVGALGLVIMGIIAVIRRLLR